MPSVRTQAESDRNPGPDSFDTLLDNIGGADAPTSEPPVSNSTPHQAENGKAEDNTPHATRSRADRDNSEPKTAKPARAKADSDIEDNPTIKKQPSGDTDVVVSTLQRADVDKAGPQAAQDPALAKQPGAEVGTDLADTALGGDPAIAPSGPATADINFAVQSAAIVAIPVPPVPVTGNAKSTTNGDPVTAAGESNKLAETLATLQAAYKPLVTGLEPGATEKQVKGQADKTRMSQAQNGREFIPASAGADQTNSDGQATAQDEVAAKDGQVAGTIVPVAGHAANAAPSAGNAESKSHSAAGELVDKLADATPQQVPATSSATPNVPQNAAALTQPLQAALAPGAPAPAQGTAVPLAGLAVEIATQSHAGKQRFEIRLDPPDLGRIDVRLDVDRDGHVTSRLVVERAETLDLLKRDSADLQRALQQAGLKTSDNALEFSLRQQGFTRDQSGTPNQPTAHLVVPTDDAAPLDVMPRRYRSLLGLGGGLDISV
jgi:flagellar hook-length control protein FliK